MCSSDLLLPLVREEWVAVSFRPEIEDDTKLCAIIDLLKPRARSLTDFATTFCGYFSDTYETDAAAVEKFLKDPAVRPMLAELGARYESAAGFTEQSAEQMLRAFAEEKGVKAGALINGARVALTGQGVAPSLFTVMMVLGQKKTVERLKKMSA